MTMGNSADDDVIIVVDDSDGFRRSCQCPAIPSMYHITTIGNRGPDLARGTRHHTVVVVVVVVVVV